jgi:ketosteroid isomerase-like protein
MTFMVSALLVFVLAAPAQAAGRADKEVTLALVDYLNAVISLDAQRVVRFCNEPLMYVSADGSTSSFATRGDLESSLKLTLAALKKRGYGRSEWPQLHVKVLSSGVAIASALIVRYKTDGKEMERLGVTYLLRKTGDGWKIAVVTVHDPSNVLDLE